MLKDIQVTLYDIFGYLLPGFIFLAGIATLFWAIFIPSTPISLSKPDAEGWVIVAIVAYIAGHMAQAIGNFIAKSMPSAESLALTKGEAGSFPEPVIRSATSKASLLLDIDPKEMDPKLLHQVCDETVAQFGSTSDRDVYIYREGFYRGLAVSFLMLFLCLAIRALIPGASLIVSEKVQPIGMSMLLFFDIVLFIAAWLSFTRYKRFGSYRVKEAVIGFLLLRAEKAKPSEAKYKLAGNLTIVCGLQGTGKTTVAKRISEGMDAVLMRTDVLRKELKIFKYSEEDKQKVYDEMFSRVQKLLQENKNVVLDATFIKQKNRDRAQQIAEEVNAGFKVVEVVCSDNVVKRRIEKRTGDESEAGFKQYLISRKSFETVLGRHITIDNSGTVNETIKQLDKYF